MIKTHKILISIMVFVTLLLALAIIVSAESVSDTLDESAEKTYEIDGTNYTISLVFVGSSSAKFGHNAVISSSIPINSTHTFSDGLRVRVDDIIIQQFGGGLRRVAFTLDVVPVPTPIPEFSAIGAAVALLGGVGVLLRRRKGDL